MVLAQMVVDSVVLEGRSIRETALTYGVSKSWVHELVRRYREGGPAALEPHSKRPRSNPRQMSHEVEEEIIALRKELLGAGDDAGAETIKWHLEKRRENVPSSSAIYFALKRRGFITPEPRKRPKASYVRFEADLPNECWQADMTHWQLDDGTEVEIINFIDDHSRDVLASVAVPVATAAEVVRTFYETAAIYGLPPRCSRTTEPSTPRRIGAATPAWRSSWSCSGSPSNTGSPTTLRPSARSSASTSP
jgi:transposase